MKQTNDNRALCALLVLLTTLSVSAQDSARFEFTRLVAHWAGYGDTNYVPSIADAQPEVAQVGFYGGHFWSLVHTPHYGGYPSHLPVQGTKEGGQWFQDLHG